MITSLPKRKALNALGLFVILIFAGIAWIVYALISSGFTWYYMTGVVVLTPLAFTILNKMSTSNKILTLGKEQLTVRYPMQFTTRNYGWKSLKGWQEITINTKSKPFKVIEFYFEPKLKVSISHTENGSYKEVYQFLRKKYGKIEIRSKK